jgi:hypothetical protein
MQHFRIGLLIVVAVLIVALVILDSRGMLLR